MTHLTVLDIDFLVLVNCVGGLQEKCVPCVHESVVMWLSATFSLSSCLFYEYSPLSFCRCALVVLHPLFLSLSLSLLSPSVLQSHDREETLGQTLTSGALRPLFWHGFPEGQVSAVCSAPFGRHNRWQGRQPVRLGSLNGEHAHYAVSLVPQWEAASLAWMSLVSQARCQGVNAGKQRSWCRNSNWKEGGARWRFRERFIFIMATSLTVNHMQPQCAVPLPHHYWVGRAASTEVHRGSGSCLNRKKRVGRVGVADCMHSHLGGGASEKLVVVC